MQRVSASPERVSARPECIATLRDLAEDHVKFMSQFPIIRQSHPAIYGIKIVSGVAAAIFSQMIYNDHEFTAVIIFSAATIFVGLTINEIYCFAQQGKKINALFAPCEQGLKIERSNKIEYIIRRNNGQSQGSLLSVKEAIEREATTYDESTDKSIKALDQPSYISLTESAQTIKKISSLNLPAGIAELAKAKLDTLIALAHRFTEGDKINNNPGEDAYVTYDLLDGKASLRSRFQ